VISGDGSMEGGAGELGPWVREPAKIVQEAALTLDFAQPVAIMMLGILNFVMDTDEARDRASAAG